MKKMLSLLLALVMALSLVACANQQNDETLNDDTLVNNDIQSEVQDTDRPAPPSDTENGNTTNNAGEGTVGNPSTDESKSDTEDKQPAETPEDEHEHDYAAKVVAATCTANGYTLHTCSCGDSYQDNTTNKLGHSYSDKVVAPTTTAKGYTLHTCSRCGDSYKDNYTAKLETSSSSKPESKPSTGSSSTSSSTGNSGSSSSSGSSGTSSQPATPSKPSTPSTPSQPTTPSKPTHQCSYTATVTPATCTTEGYTTYTCSCGDSYTDDYTSLKRHQWEDVWEEVPVYETVEINRCSICHEEITGSPAAHGKEHALKGEGSGHYGDTKQVQVGTENQVVGYACGVCGTPK